MIWERPLADGECMAPSRRWDEANRLLQETAELCAESLCTIELLREHETELWRELSSLRDDLERLDEFEATLAAIRARMNGLADGRQEVDVDG